MSQKAREICAAVAVLVIVVLTFAPVAVVAVSRWKLSLWWLLLAAVLAVLLVTHALHLVRKARREMRREARWNS